MQSDVDRYLVHCAAMGLSERTIEQRQSALKDLVRWLADRSITLPNDVSKSVLERYRRYLYHFRFGNGKALSLATQRNRLTHTKQLFNYLAQENIILYDPAASLALPKPHKRLPRAVLTKAEVETILNQTSKSGAMGIRDRAILETFYATGIRRTELVNLELYDVDTDQQTIMVRQGKGRKDRLLPIGQRACRWIQKYIEEIRPELITSLDQTTLFLTDYGEPFIKGRLTPLIKKYLKAAHVDKPGACHLFRHTMATLMLENGADLRFIQAMLGHADISTTTIYTQVSIRKLREVYSRTHPVRPRPDDHPPEVTKQDLFDELDREAEADDD